MVWPRPSKTNFTARGSYRPSSRATCSILSLGTALATETVTMAGLQGSLIPILYGGLLSVGVAYTLQVVAQKHAKPSHAAIILSMESVFGAIGGSLLISERMDTRGLIGCGLILAGVLISQISFQPKPKPIVADSLSK